MAATPIGNVLQGTTTDWGFGVSDLWSSAMGIITTLAPFILLGLAIVLVPRIIKMIKNAAGGGGGKK